MPKKKHEPEDIVMKLRQPQSEGRPMQDKAKRSDRRCNRKARAVGLRRYCLRHAFRIVPAVISTNSPRSAPVCLR
jgi:hypothetical protein